MDSTYSFIRGSDLCKFYSRPIDIKLKPKVISESSDSESDTPISSSKKNALINFVTVATQTDYRESETQTDPWDPPFTVRKVRNEPEVLSLKNLSYGNGLPATELEIDYILENRKNRDLDAPSEKCYTPDVFMKKKQLICNQVQNEWNYKISRHSEKQLSKLQQMEITLLQELTKQSEKKDKLLKSIWTQKNNQMSKMSSKLKKELVKELKVLEQKSKSKAQNNVKNRTEAPIKEYDRSLHADKHRDSLNEEINYLLSKYYMNPNGLAKITDWLQRKKTEFYNDIPLARPIQRTKSEKLTERAYQDLLTKKRTKMPPKLYREDYDQEESEASSIKGEVEFEVLELPEEGIDLVTVWQQVLRGRAYQKQMLELIAKHQDALNVLLS